MFRAYISTLLLASSMRVERHLHNSKITMPTSDCLKHPGFGLPVTKIAASSHGCRDEHSYFEHAIDIGLAISGVTLREKAMLDFVCQISDKPQWCEKVFSEEIVARWRAECGDEDSRGSMRDHKCFAYVSLSCVAVILTICPPAGGGAQVTFYSALEERWVDANQRPVHRGAS